jgi:hypothetical protein
MTEETNFGEGFVSLDQWANLSILSNSLRLLEDNSLNISLNLTYGSKNLQKLALMDSRLISSLSISKSLFNKKGTVSLIIEDLFNEQDFFETTSYLNQSSQLFTNLDNRFIKLGFSYKFGNTKLSTNERTTDVEERKRLKDLQKP